MREITGRINTPNRTAGPIPLPFKHWAYASQGGRTSSHNQGEHVTAHEGYGTKPFWGLDFSSKHQNKTFDLPLPSLLRLGQPRLISDRTGGSEGSSAPYGPHYVLLSLCGIVYCVR